MRMLKSGDLTFPQLKILKNSFFEQKIKEQLLESFFFTKMVVQLVASELLVFE